MSVKTRQTIEIENEGISLKVCLDDDGDLIIQDVLEGTETLVTAADILSFIRSLDELLEDANR